MTLSASALGALGLWSLLSVAWGGIPDVAWRAFDESLVAAAALLLGSLVAGARRSAAVSGGVLAGLAAVAADLMYRLATGPVPADWFEGRKVAGPVGYANAQGALFAVGVPLALWAACSRRLVVRIAGGGAAGLLTGALLLTQSRGALLALGVALVLQAVVARDLRVGAFGVAVGATCAALWLPLRAVDAALVDGGSTHEVAFRHFGGWTLLAGLVLALFAAPEPRAQWTRRALLGGALAALVTLVAVGTVVAVDRAPEVRSTLAHAFDDGTASDLPAGETRFTSLSLTGRIQTWRLAARLFEAKPLLGIGRGVYGQKWTEARTTNNSYVLQPHSIELELLSELGVPGLVAFLGFVGCAALALAGGRTGSAGLRAAAAAMLAVLLLQATVDWTLSFPALVVAVLLVVGAAAGARPPRLGGLLPAFGLGAAALALLVGLAGPYLAARKLDEAQAAVTDPARSWRIAASAHSYDRWNEDVVAWQGRLAEAAGEFRLAASLYGRAAGLSTQPSIDEFLRARALRLAGLHRESAAACRRALTQNPLESRIRYSFCAQP